MAYIVSRNKKANSRSIYEVVKIAYEVYSQQR